MLVVVIGAVLVSVFVHRAIGMCAAVSVIARRLVLMLMIRIRVTVRMLMRHAVDVRMWMSMLILRSHGRRFARDARGSPPTRRDQSGGWCRPHGTHKYSSAARRNARQPHAQRHPVWRLPIVRPCSSSTGPSRSKPEEPTSATSASYVLMYFGGRGTGN